MIVRAATSADAPAIARIHTGAFPTPAEARLVERLHADGDVLVSLIAEDAGAALGHVLFSRMTVEADSAPVAAAGLAPVAVIPERQARGVGAALIEAGLAALTEQGVALCFVLGDPRYYGRFGFEVVTARPFASPYAGRHLLARWLGTPRAVASGRADYAPAFAEVAAA